MTKTTFDAWLAGSHAIVEASTLTNLVIAVANAAAQEWLSHRLHPVISRTVAGLAGHPVDIHFTHNYTKEPLMNVLEDRLHAHSTTSVSNTASPSGHTLPLAASQRQLACLEQKLMQAGIVPTNPIELPANITPELLNILLSEGDEPMNNPSNLTQTRVRIHSHMTQSRFLHVEDALSIGKIRLFAGNYRRNQKMDSYAYHFIDLADARIIFGALAHAEQGFSHKEYKGTPPKKNKPSLDGPSLDGPSLDGPSLDGPSLDGPSLDGPSPDGHGPVSRILSIAIKGDNVYMELKTGPGKLTDTGAITPNGKPEVEINVGFKLYEARRMAASVLAYIHAWDVLRMMVNQQMVSQPVPYLLVSTTNEGKDNQTTAAQTKGAPKPNGTIKSPVGATENSRPVTRKDPIPKTNGLRPKQTNGQQVKPAPPVNGQPEKLDTTVVDGKMLKYGDGVAVNGGNLTEVQTFQRYIAEKDTVPESKVVLLNYYRVLNSA
jgi:hypothetical protein